MNLSGCAQMIRSVLCLVKFLSADSTVGAINAGAISMLLLTLSSLGAEAADKERILHSFTGADGALPTGDLIADGGGDLFGTSVSGGSANWGTVFRVTPRGHEKVLYSFKAYPDGAQPYGALVMDGQGNLYGTTYQGGANSQGRVFKITPKGKEIVLHDFFVNGGQDGAGPRAGLIQDDAGNLYGTTETGGQHAGGVIFKITPNNEESILYSFAGGTDCRGSNARLLRDENGNLYGTTLLGGEYDNGCVFRLGNDGQETVLYSFTGGNDGGQPRAGLIADQEGNLYGTALGGTHGAGVIFKIETTGAMSVLHNFSGSPDGGTPYGDLVQDAHGGLYGTTVYGGQFNSGTVFKLKSDGTLKVLHSFAAGSDGSAPYAGLLMDLSGNLYGTTKTGGAGNFGTVLKINH